MEFVLVRVLSVCIGLWCSRSVCLCNKMLGWGDLGVMR